MKAVVGKKLAAKKKNAEIIISRLEKVFPEAHCELTHNSPFQLLVSVVLSAQTTDKNVNKVMAPLYELGFDAQTILNLGQENFKLKIKSIGLANTKAKNVYNLAKIINEKYYGEVPSTREELEALPGVGRKTANVILGEIFNQPTLAVDTHVFRVSNRLGLQDEKTPEKCELKLLECIESKFLPKTHHLFIFHGRYTCIARGPKCESCSLANICPYFKKLSRKSAK